MQDILILRMILLRFSNLSQILAYYSCFSSSLHHPSIHPATPHIFSLIRGACHISHRRCASIKVTELFPWVWDRVCEKFSTATRRTARTGGAGAEFPRGDYVRTLHRPFQVPKTTGPVEKQLCFLLTSEQCELNLVSPGRIDQCLLISLLPSHVPGFMIHSS